MHLVEAPALTSLKTLLYICTSIAHAQDGVNLVLLLPHQVEVVYEYLDDTYSCQSWQAGTGKKNSIGDPSVKRESLAITIDEPKEVICSLLGR